MYINNLVLYTLFRSTVAGGDRSPVRKNLSVAKQGQMKQKKNW